jgi:hypothetical protein
MSDTSSLTQLARFVGQSALSSPDPRDHLRAVNAITSNLAPTLQRRGVGELLGVVLALSARTRRMVMPKVTIELDVFAPDGRRAATVVTAHRG